MSIRFDPKGPNPSSSDSNYHNQTKSPFNLFKRWVELIHEGYKIERTPCRTYCWNKWNEEENTIPIHLFEQSMETCIKECEHYQSFADWHRHN